MPVVLKMKYQDEVRRVLLDLDEVTYSDVCSGVQSAFAHLESSCISMKYIDDEGDLCTLCPSTLEDCVANAVEISGRKILKLELFQAKERPSAAAAASWAHTAGATAVGGATTAAAAAAAAAGKQSESTETCWAKQSPSQADHWNDWGTEMHQKWAAAVADWHKKWADAGKGWAQQSQGQAADHWNSYMKHWMNAAKHWNDHQAACWKGFAQQMAAGTADHSQDQAAYWSHDHCGAKWKKEEDWILKPKKMLWLLCRLRESGCLSSEMLASIFVSLLSPMIAKVADHQENLHWKLLLKWKKTEILPILECLSELASRTPGLEHCSEALMAVGLGHEHASAGEALLMLLTAVDTLPFPGQIAFAQSFFKAQEERLYQHLDAQDDWMPCWSKKVSLDHWGITCDGCNMHPIKGPRFKCLTRENYDLCGECFAKKTAILNEEHEFQIIVTDSGMWKQKAFYGKGMDWKGNGKGKKKGHGKGKWFCGNGWWADDHDHAEEQEHSAAFAGSADWKAEEEEQVVATAGEEAAADAWGAFYGKGMDCKAKGKGKKKGHGKGKWFWGKGWWADEYDHAKEQEQAAAFAGSAPLKAGEEEQGEATAREEAATTTSQKIRPCASEGCSFQATFLEKFCCNACKGSSASHHGPRCERKPVSQEDAA